MVTIVFFSNTKIVTLGKNPAGFIPLFSALDFFVYRTAIVLNIVKHIFLGFMLVGGAASSPHNTLSNLPELFLRGGTPLLLLKAFSSCAVGR